MDMTMRMLTRRKIVAAIFFLLAAEILVFAGTYFYLEANFPTSSQFIERNLDSSEVVDKFKIAEAKKAGYSEKEIADYLALQNSEKHSKYARHLLMAEGTLFVVALLVGLGLIVLVPGAPKSKE